MQDPHSKLEITPPPQTHQVYFWSVHFFNSLLFLCPHVYTWLSYSEKPDVNAHINTCISTAAPMASPLTFHHPSGKLTTIHSLLSLNSLLDCFPTGPHIPFLYQAYRVHLEKEPWTSKKNNAFFFYLMFPNKDLHELQRSVCGGIFLWHQTPT